MDHIVFFFCVALYLLSNWTYDGLRAFQWAADFGHAKAKLIPVWKRIILSVIYGPLNYYRL